MSVMVSYFPQRPRSAGPYVGSSIRVYWCAWELHSWGHSAGQFTGSEELPEGHTDDQRNA